MNILELIDLKLIYNILFEASSETLKTLYSDKKYLGAKIGYTSVLHTWRQNVGLHPHIHCIIPGGDMDSLGRWKPSKKKFFLPVKVLSEVFQGKYLDRLKKSFDTLKLAKKEQLQEIIDICYEKQWVVYKKKATEKCKACDKIPRTLYS